jgi:hypothetical protein
MLGHQAGLSHLNQTCTGEVRTQVFSLEDFAHFLTGRGDPNHARRHDRRHISQTIPMPPHLHRRTPLRKSLPPPRRVLLLPPHHSQSHRQPAAAPQPPLHLRSPAARRPFRDPGLHWRGPPPHRFQQHRPPPRWPSPLRPPDCQPQPPQASHPPQHQTRIRNRNRGRDHHPPQTRRPRSARRSRRDHPPQKRSRPPDRTHDGKR